MYVLIQWETKEIELSVYSPKDNDNQLRPVLTVSELTGQIKDILEGTFSQVYVAGEISNAKVYPSGHWYFSLKDQNSTLPCVCFKGANQYIKFKLEDGLQVIARGKLSVYPPRGAYQLVATRLEPVGIGEWQLAFEQLKKQLEGEGLLAAERKRPIPMLPKKVGVVTSPAGAAVQDIINTLTRRNSSVKILISPAKVQGEGSVETIVEAIELLNEIDDLDVMIVARGGGSIEDLWSFNTEAVARAVAGARVPVISGVGHETDVTICDLVADLRAPTPTAAAELVARGHQELLDRWGVLNDRLIDIVESRLYDARIKLDRLSPERSLMRYEERLRSLMMDVGHKKERLIQSITAILKSSSHRWSEADKRLMDLGPRNVMSRGFSILRTADGDLIRDYKNVKPGDRLEVLLEKGKLLVEVKESDKDWW